MSLALLVETISKGAVLSFTGLAVAWFARNSPQARGAVWTTLAIGLVTLPLIILASPELPILPSFDSRSPGPDTLEALAYLWFAGAALCGVHFAWSLLQLTFWRTKWSRTCTDERLLRAMARAAQRAALRRPPELRLGDDPIAPFTAGWRRPWVWLPHEAHEWPDEVLASVLAHECCHIRLQHFALRRFAALACALHWPNPLVWLAYRTCIRDQELECDDRATVAIDRAQYASALIEAARRLRAATNGATAANAALQLRIARLTRHATVQSGNQAIVGAAVAMLLATFLFGTVAPDRHENHAHTPGDLFGPGGLFEADWFAPRTPR